ncbi:Sec-independent protein translocase subunit TatA [Peterkaempfera bronchialis]|uniref:Sec-independent protein translocase protein TatA n=1 Tax=Peterkaempfera bronchialis TaxID=2126346 RepID=A0A345T5Z0_9ACTN|nr:Sec-independent protein translocase subunit TatA [Peterkaempfera bronchialis]AXI81395.1 twin-arginine translocase TatA/TatE family subunit [Peterkaempfera bronchialis]
MRNGLEPWHLILVLVVVVLLFGSKKLPEIARGLGKSMRILKAETKAMRDEAPTVERVTASEQPSAMPTAATPAAEAEAEEQPQRKAS